MPNNNFKSKLKHLLQIDDIPLDHWKKTEGLLESDRLTWWAFRITIYHIINGIKICFSFPFWLIRLPYQVGSILFEYEQLHFSQMRKIQRGVGCVIDRQSWLINGQNIELGNFVKISAFSSLMAGNNARISIGTNTIISTCVVIVAFNHGYLENEVPIRYQPWIDDANNSIEIGANVWIGANVVILPGSKIGDGAIIAAGSVIKGSVTGNCIYVNRHDYGIKSKGRS